MLGPPFDDRFGLVVPFAVVREDLQSGTGAADDVGALCFDTRIDDRIVGGFVPASHLEFADLRLQNLVHVERGLCPMGLVKPVCISGVPSALYVAHARTRDGAAGGLRSRHRAIPCADVDGAE